MSNPKIKLFLEKYQLNHQQNGRGGGKFELQYKNKLKLKIGIRQLPECLKNNKLGRSTSKSRD